ncbi:MAG: transcriptional regulator [Synechococcus sp. EAC657]|nr:transcriptional regulator [Synechococcus sp. EAC657]
MSTRRCVQCGSSSFRADRSLGGRLVCNRCGTPADQRRASGRAGSPIRASPRGQSSPLFWIVLGLVVLVLVLIFQAA